MKQSKVLDDLTERIHQDLCFEKIFIREVLKSFLRVLPDFIFSGKEFIIPNFCKISFRENNSNHFRLEYITSREALRIIRKVNERIDKRIS